jgi:hypothetical protein
MTKPVKEPVKLSRKAVIGFWVGTSLLFSFMLSKCSEEPGVSAAQREKYQACLAVKQASVGWIKADAACHYLKRS